MRIKYLFFIMTFYIVFFKLVILLFFSYNYVNFIKVFFYWNLLLDHGNCFYKKNYASNKKRHAFIKIKKVLK